MRAANQLKLDQIMADFGGACILIKNRNGLGSGVGLDGLGWEGCCGVCWGCFGGMLGVCWGCACLVDVVYGAVFGGSVGVCWGCWEARSPN